jgi:hypothetical protein
LNAPHDAGKAAMQQIADWLKQLGMSEYAERFAENGIDISVLRDLTDQDLNDIGVLLGHRRKILRAIGELSSAAPLATEPAVGTEPKVQDTAERRQVTVMFSDLVGSTALSARMDPEDLLQRNVAKGPAADMFPFFIYRHRCSLLRELLVDVKSRFYFSSAHAVGGHPLSVSFSFRDVQKSHGRKPNLRPHGGCGRSDEECTGRMSWRSNGLSVLAFRWPASFLQAD